MSKGWEQPGTVHSHGMEDFLAQIYDLTHTIDAVENNIDAINALRIKIKKVPRSLNLLAAAYPCTISSTRESMSDQSPFVRTWKLWQT